MQLNQRTEEELYRRQADIEELYSKRRVRQLVQEEIAESPEIVEAIRQAAERTQAWLDQEWYLSKQKRLSGLKGMNLEALYGEIMVCLLLLDRPEQLTATVGRVVGCLRFEDAVDGVKTAAELLAHMSEVDLIDIDRDAENCLLVIPVYEVSQALRYHINRTSYLPPMIVPPLELTHNWSGGLLTEKSSVILRKGHHNEDVCLDHLNRMNQVALRLDLEFLKTYSMEPNPDKPLDTLEKAQAWQDRANDAYRVFALLAKEGNRFHLTHKYDKRLRTYAQGYQVSYQGDEFRKAIVEFADGETVTVPEEYRL